jgi:hypothetical protein
MPGEDRPTLLFLSNAAQRPGQSAGLTGEGPRPGLLGEGLARRGFTVSGRPLNGFPLNPLAGRGTFYAGFDPLRALRVLLLDRRVDVIVSVGESNIALILLLARWLRFRPRIVLREISAPGWAKRDRIVGFVMPRVDGVLALTPAQKAWADTAFPMKRPASMVGFAVDEGFFTPQDRARQDFILAVGDDFGRDYACLIAACEGISTPLVLRTGNAPAIPDAMRDRVKVLGRMSYAALRDLYAAAGLVVLTLHDVVSPSGVTTLYEAMAMGCAVIASDVGSTRHVVVDGQNGVLVPVGDNAALRSAMERLMGDATLRARLGAAARRTIEADFSYGAYVDRFADSLESLLAEPSPMPRRS